MTLELFGPHASYVRNFGSYARSLRKARGLTQEQLAERAALSVDTIRRLEHADFAPSLITLLKLGDGLRLPLSTMFLALEAGGEDADAELAELVSVLRQRPQVPVRALIALVEAWTDTR